VEPPSVFVSAATSSCNQTAAFTTRRVSGLAESKCGSCDTKKRLVIAASAVVLGCWYSAGKRQTRTVRLRQDSGDIRPRSSSACIQTSSNSVPGRQYLISYSKGLSIKSCFKKIVRLIQDGELEAFDIKTSPEPRISDASCSTCASCLTWYSNVTC